MSKLTKITGGTVVVTILISAYGSWSSSHAAQMSGTNTVEIVRAV